MLILVWSYPTSPLRLNYNPLIEEVNNELRKERETLQSIIGRSEIIVDRLETIDKCVLSHQPANLTKDVLKSQDELKIAIKTYIEELQQAKGKLTMMKNFKPKPPATNPSPETRAEESRPPATNSSPQTMQEESKAKLKALIEKEESIKNKFNDFLAELKQMQLKLAEREEEIKTKNAEITAKEEIIKVREETIQQQEDQIKAKEKEIAEKKSELESKVQEVLEQKNSIEQKEETVALLTNKLNNSKATLEKVQSSNVELGRKLDSVVNSLAEAMNHMDAIKGEEPLEKAESLCNEWGPIVDGSCEAAKKLLGILNIESSEITGGINDALEQLN
jgi:hypothetical protein